MVATEPDSKKSSRPAADEITHIVCGCRADKTPRLALCGEDCTDGDERRTDETCVVCIDLIGQTVRNHRQHGRCL